MSEKVTPILTDNAVAPQLLAAYHVAKGLCELLNSLHGLRAHFPEAERANIRQAATSAVSTYAWLDALICDQGNNAGLQQTRGELADSFQQCLDAKLNKRASAG